MLCRLRSAAPAVKFVCAVHSAAAAAAAAAAAEPTPCSLLHVRPAPHHDACRRVAEALLAARRARVQLLLRLDGAYGAQRLACAESASRDVGGGRLACGR
eukprot:6190326-Pleurochrysis_carterae.AAC.2